jgi:excisionase family DNA binding protein
MRAGKKTVQTNSVFSSEKADTKELENLKTTKEAAAFLKLSETYLKQLTSEGKIPHFKFGRQNRYRTKDLCKLIQPGKTGV